MDDGAKVIFEYMPFVGRRIVGWRGKDWEVRIPVKYLGEFNGCLERN